LRFCRTNRFIAHTLSRNARPEENVVDHPMIGTTQSRVNFFMNKFRKH
jgi:hypothetical protein